MTALIEIRGVAKRFGSVRVLSNIDLDVYAGETLGLVGDNAAGKSTLMKILIGFYRADRGTIQVGGQIIHHPTPHLMRSLGLEIVYQDLALEDNLDIQSNVFLGRELHYSTWQMRKLNTRAMRSRCETALKQLELDLHPNLPVRRLSGGQRQAIAIARALAFDPKLIILDEPTNNLSASRVETVLRLVKRLKAMGVATIIISHRSDEVFEVGDRVAVIKEGHCVGTAPIPEITRDEVASLIVWGTRHANAQHHIDGSDQDTADAVESRR
jgi:simple sugar transport system ATP-binding protein